ncbi:hypothetical protein A2U01_0070161, partial [Trifolium medium]|nr:hypothetical protein [Trifolium medium]
KVGAWRNRILAELRVAQQI